MQTQYETFEISRNTWEGDQNSFYQLLTYFHVIVTKQIISISTAQEMCKMCDLQSSLFKESVFFKKNKNHPVTALLPTTTEELCISLQTMDSREWAEKLVHSLQKEKLVH